MKDEPLVKAILEDWRTAPVNERMRAMLGFLEKVTLTPTEVGP
jgi:alkylhydroperoxidase family enzyme